MNTNRAAIATGTRLGAHLDQLLTSRFLPARRASRVWIPSELPASLEQCVHKLAPDTEWRAYSDDVRVFFAIAQRSIDHGFDAVSAAMDVYLLDSEAAVYSAGKWAYTREHGWWLDAVLPPSYDPQNGWWLNVVMVQAQDPLPRCAERSHRPLAIESGRRASAIRMPRTQVRPVTGPAGTSKRATAAL